jgi:hypothetical protein
MKWFARGRLWESPEDAQSAQRRGRERRARDWRPGGEHRDPRTRFEIPRDEKRRRFAAKQRRDFRDRSGSVSPQEPSDRPPHPRERTDRDRPREPRSGKPPARPGEQRDQDRRPPRPEWKDRSDRKPSAPRDRPPRDGERRSPQPPTGWSPKSSEGTGKRPRTEAGKGPHGSKDRFTGHGKHRPDRGFRPDARQPGTARKRGDGRGRGGRGGGSGGGQPA